MTNELSIKPVAWTSKKGLRRLKSHGFCTVGKSLDQERGIALYTHDDVLSELAEARQELDEWQAEAAQWRAAFEKNAGAAASAVAALIEFEEQLNADRFLQSRAEEQSK